MNFVSDQLFREQRLRQHVTKYLPIFTITYGSHMMLLTTRTLECTNTWRKISIYFKNFKKTMSEGNDLTQVAAECSFTYYSVQHEFSYKKK